MRLPAPLTNMALLAVAVLGVGGMIAVVVFAKPTPPPASLTAAVPFTTQAPDGNWDNNENCEEASATMANAYLRGDTSQQLTAADVEKSITLLVSWEQTHFGHSDNTGASETAQMISAVFHLHATLLSPFTENDLKTALAAHRVVLLPLNAQELGNPAYQGSGRIYHMIVLRGYHGDQFVVNDPGVSNGDGNTYSFTTLSQAAADWNSAQHILDRSRQVAIVVGL